MRDFEEHRQTSGGIGRATARTDEFLGRLATRVRALCAYSRSSQESLRSRELLKDWAAEGFITAAQYQRMETDTICDLRRTNIFLRLVLFVFTSVLVGAAVAMFFMIFLPSKAMQTTGVSLLILAAACYAGAEIAVREGRLYRYGIEEALVAWSTGLLCTGLQFALFDNAPYSSRPTGAGFLVPAIGVAISLWIWRRFGLPYAFPAAMIFVVWLPGYWTLSHSAQHVIIAGFYAAGLFLVAAIRRGCRVNLQDLRRPTDSRPVLAYLDPEYSVAEAFLWLGIYLAMNLQVSPVKLPAYRLISVQMAADFSRPFYWSTWVLTWCLPPLVLMRGLRQKDRLVMAAGALAAILTLVTNKPYLGWPRQTWDPMILGAFLMGVAVFIRRWLGNGPRQSRHGFTARRLSAKDKSWMNAGAAAIGFVSPNSMTPSSQTGSSGFHYGGGDFGGGGASSDY